jgi:hypothetical protein
MEMDGKGREEIFTNYAHLAALFGHKYSHLSHSKIRSLYHEDTPEVFSHPGTEP